MLVSGFEQGHAETNRQFRAKPLRKIRCLIKSEPAYDRSQRGQSGQCVPAMILVVALSVCNESPSNPPAPAVLTPAASSMRDAPSPASSLASDSLRCLMRRMRRTRFHHPHQRRAGNRLPQPRGVPSVPANAESSPQLPSFSEPSWQAVVLVCKACKKRRNAPDKLKAGALVRAIQEGLRPITPRPRVVTTSCLGLCPKGATAVALVSGNGVPHITSVNTWAQVTALCGVTAHLLKAY